MYVFGLIMLALTLVFYCLAELLPVHDQDHYVGWFFANYFFTVIYFGALLFSGRLRRRRKGLHLMILFLLIFLVSCFSLNRVVGLFAPSADWFAVTIILASANYAAFAFQRFIPTPLRVLMFFVLGISFCCFLYMALYIGEYNIYGVVGFFLLGIPLHTIAPLLFCIYIICLWWRSRRISRWYNIGFLSGVGATVVFVAVYALSWRVNLVEIEKEYARSQQENGLPSWVNVVSNASSGLLTDKVLIAEGRYVIPDHWMSARFRRWGTIQVEHDPLVFMAAWLGGSIEMPWEDRVHILETLSDYRDDDEERLWSDRDLITTHVQTATHIWPRLRLAYTEKTINVKNEDTWKGSQEEAIYKFHLPEGAVVSSLSLWINGREEKGILTTKSKADSAYKTIVGRERRDPSVVHWRDGNMVTVRVFPVIGQEERQFKVGITAPLPLERGALTYRNIDFEGPSFNNAREQADISFETMPAGLQYSPMFVKKEQKGLIHAGEYREDWELSFRDEGLVHQVFSNKDMLYTAVPYRKEMGNVAVSTVYLDINNAWTHAEMASVVSMLKKYKIRVYADNMFRELTADNQSMLFDQLSDHRFSLFPFHQVPDPEKALVITKSVRKSPRIDDLRDCLFVDDLKKWLDEGHRIMLFNLGGELSPYLRTLKECRTFRFDEGDLTVLKSLIDTHQFPMNIENEQRIVIESANMAILANSGSSGSTAPDHLQRLFAYNHIMQAMGPHLLTGGETADTLVAEAKAAHIVTPLSSLIVLETQADYDRFDIKDSNDSLKNAVMANNGAVPEPHEWLLIIGACVLIFWLKYRPAILKRFA
jgi:XrtN system VIT domain protein